MSFYIQSIINILNQFGISIYGLLITIFTGYYIKYYSVEFENTSYQLAMIICLCATTCGCFIVDEPIWAFIIAIFFVVFANPIS
jgi:hypothetical protein